MGVSTDAYLYFGFDIYDAEEGLNLINFPDGIEDEGEYIDNLWLLAKQYDIEINCHCHADYPIWFISAKRYSARRGYPQVVDQNELLDSEDYRVKIKKACEGLGIEFKEPKWTLASYWG